MAETTETPEMLFEMGKRFYLPSGGVADPLLALHYFGRAAEKGYAPAQRVLGSCYLEGRLAPQDYEKARQWLTAAANQGDAQAAYSLALIYAQGWGIAKDWGLAWRLLDRDGTRDLPDARALKETLKSGLARSHPRVAEQLKEMEETRRAHYNSSQKRFIMPWFTSGRLPLAREEFEIWLGLNLGRLSEAEAVNALAALLTLYYDQVESSRR